MTGRGTCKMLCHIPVPISKISVLLRWIDSNHGRTLLHLLLVLPHQRIIYIIVLSLGLLASLINHILPISSHVDLVANWLLMLLHLLSLLSLGRLCTRRHTLNFPLIFESDWRLYTICLLIVILPVLQGFSRFICH